MKLKSQERQEDEDLVAYRKRKGELRLFCGLSIGTVHRFVR